MEMHDAKELESWVDQRLATLNPTDGWQPNVSAAFTQFQQKRRVSSWLKRGWIVAVATAAAILLFGLLPSPEALAHKCLQCSVAVWQTLASSGSVHTNLPAENGRKPVPDFEREDARGKAIKLSSLKGKVVLLNFWATWCEGCRLEIPSFVEFQKQYADQGFTVIGISLDDDGWKAVHPWMKQKAVNYPIVIGDQNLGKQYGLDGMPLTVLVDRNGNIADVHPGLMDKSDTQQKIRSLLKETPNGTP